MKCAMSGIGRQAWRKGVAVVYVAGQQRPLPIDLGRPFALVPTRRVRIYSVAPAGTSTTAPTLAGQHLPSVSLEGTIARSLCSQWTGWGNAMPEKNRGKVFRFTFPPVTLLLSTCMAGSTYSLLRVY